MEINNWLKTIAFAVSMLTVGCNTTSNIRLTDNVRKVITYETDKKIKVVRETIEMEDPVHFGQWWEAKKISVKTYEFTSKGLKNKRQFEDEQMFLDAGNASDDGY